MANNDVMLSNVIGAPFDRGVLAQLYMRAYKNSAPRINQSNNANITRSSDQILFLANKTAWVRLISSVDIVLPPTTTGQAASQTDLTKYYTELGLDTSTSNQVAKYVEQNSLARNWVLEAGTSTINAKGINLRYGLGNEGSYGLGGIYEQGYRPMPGLTSVNIDTAGRLGSLRYANINFKVWNMNQLNAVEALYFRLGYSMLLEWGHTQYYTNEGTLITNDVYGITDPFQANLRKEAVQQAIAVKAGKTDYNYDGMLGIVTNFTWAFNQEGGYDCTVKLIGLGSIIDSLRINQAYKLPSGLIKGFKNSKKLIEDINNELAAEAYAAAHPPPTTTGTTTNTTTLPQPPTSVIDLIRDIQKYDVPETTPGFDLLSLTVFIRVEGSADNAATPFGGGYYYKSRNTDATQNKLNDERLFGLFPGKRGGGFIGRIPSKGSTQVKLNYDAIANQTAQSYFELNGTGVLAVVSDEITAAGAAATSLSKLASWYFALMAETQITDASLFNTITDGLVDLVNPTFVKVTADQYVYPDEEPGNITWTLPYNWSNGVTTNTYNVTFRYKAGDRDHPLTRLQVATAFDSALKNNITITSVEKEGPFGGKGPRDNFVKIKATAQTVVKDVPYNVAATGGFTQPKDVVAVFELEFDNPGLIESIAGQPAANPPTSNQAGTGSLGNTSGATNTPRSDQDNDAFESALVAMLAYVKTVTQAKSGGKQVFEYTLPVATRIFYQDGVLQGLDDADFKPKGPFVATQQTGSFELTKYARKGFNAALMRDPSLYGSTPDVDFSELCKSYLVAYGEATATNIAASSVYIPLGYLLAFLNNMCLIYDTTADLSTNPTQNKDVKHPYLYIDFNPETNFCLTTPQQMSIDPSVCLIPFDGNNDDYKEIYDPAIYSKLDKSSLWKPQTQNQLNKNILPFRVSGDVYQAKIMNILMNVDYLLGLANSFATADPEQSVNLKRFLETMMVDVNKALGGYNVFRVAYIDESNTVQIRDDQYTPNRNQTTLLDRNNYIQRTYRTSGLIASNYLQADISDVQYGQLPVFGLQSLVRSFEFKTNMSTKLASMIAISAQAATGSVNAKDGSTLAYLNRNYQDRYKPRVVNPSQGPVGPAQQGGKKQAADNDLTAAETFNTHVKSIYYQPKTFDALRTVAAKNYYIERSALVKTKSVKTVGSPFIPADCELTIDGIGGILMGQAFTIPEDRIPSSLKDPLDGYTNVGFIVTGLNHTIDNNEWLTKVKGQMILLRNDVSPSPDRIISRLEVQQTAANVGQPATPGECDIPYAGYNGSPVAPSTTIRDVYIPARDSANLTLSKGFKLLMTAQTQLEGFSPGSVSYTTNNPGNIGTNTNVGANVKKSYNTLKEGIEAQQQFYQRILDGRSNFYKMSDTLYKYLYQYAPPCYNRKSDGVLVRGSDDPTAYTNFVINWFKYQGYTLSDTTTLTEINAIT